MPRVDGLNLGINVDTAAFEAGMRRAAQAVNRASRDIVSDTEDINDNFREMIATTRGLLRFSNDVADFFGVNIDTRRIELAVRDWGRAERAVRNTLDTLRLTAIVAQQLDNALFNRETLRRWSDEANRATGATDEFSDSVRNTSQSFRTAADSVNGFQAAQETYNANTADTVRANNRMHDSVAPVREEFNRFAETVGTVGNSLGQQDAQFNSFAQTLSSAGDSSASFANIHETINDVFDDTGARVADYTSNVEDLGETTSETENSTLALLTRLAQIGSRVSRATTSFGGFARQSLVLFGSLNDVSDALGNVADRAERLEDSPFVGSGEARVSGFGPDDPQGPGGAPPESEELGGLNGIFADLFLGFLGIRQALREIRRAFRTFTQGGDGAEGARVFFGQQGRSSAQVFTDSLNAIANTFTATGERLRTIANRIFSASLVTSITTAFATLVANLNQLSAVLRNVFRNFNSFWQTLRGLYEQGNDFRRNIFFASSQRHARRRFMDRDSEEPFRPRNRFERVVDSGRAIMSRDGLAIQPRLGAEGSNTFVGPLLPGRQNTRILRGFSDLIRLLFRSLPAWAQVTAAITGLTLVFRALTTVAVPAYLAAWDRVIETLNYYQTIGFDAADGFAVRIANLNFVRDLVRVQDAYADAIRFFFIGLNRSVAYLGRVLQSTVTNVFDFIAELFRAGVTLTLPQLLREWWDNIVAWRDNYIQENLGGNTISIFEFFFDNEARGDFINQLRTYREVILAERRALIAELNTPLIPLDIDIFNQNPAPTRRTRPRNQSFFDREYFPGFSYPLIPLNNTSRSFRDSQGRTPGRLPVLRGDSREIAPIAESLAESISSQLQQFYDTVRIPGDLPALQDLDRTVTDRTLDNFLEFLSDGFRTRGSDRVARTLQEQVEQRFDEYIEGAFTTEYLNRTNNTISRRQRESENILRQAEQTQAERLRNERERERERLRQQQAAQRERERLLREQERAREEELAARQRELEERRRQQEEYQRYLQEIIQVPISQLSNEQFRDRIEQTAPRFFENLSSGFAAAASDSLFSDRFRRDSESWGEALSRRIGEAFRNSLNNNLQNFLSEHLNRFFSRVFNGLIGGIFGTETTSGVARGLLGGLFGGGNGDFVGPPRRDGTFHEGGIVGGFGATTGQEQYIRALSGEAVFNQAQKDRLLFAVANGSSNGQGQGVTIQINNQVTGDVTSATRRAIQENSREMAQMVGSELQRMGVVR